MSILNVEHLSHGFGDRAIFEDVSFRLLKGEHIGLIGANGEGKSTFMNIVTGKRQPDEGKVEWSKNVRALTVRAVKLSGEDDDVQMSLFSDEQPDEKRERMERAAYELENKFGKGTVTFGSLMANDKLPFNDDEEDSRELYKNFKK